MFYQYTEGSDEVITLQERQRSNKIWINKTSLMETSSLCENRMHVILDKKDTWSAYHLYGIFGNNFSTNGTGRSAPAENRKEMNCTICVSFSNPAKVWVQTNMTADVSLGLC